MPHAARLSALLLPIALLSLALRHGHHGSQALAARSLTLVPAQQRLLLSPPPKVKPPAPKPPPSPRRPPPPRPSPPKPVVAAVAKPAPSPIKAVLPLRSPPPPSPSPSSPPTPFPPGITTYPGQLLDLSNWKVQLPTPGPLGVAEETVKQPQLASYIQPLYFYPTAGNTAVAFVANAGGATTSGSKYARSELQEVVYSGRGGAVAANWNISGPVIHTMTFTGATLRLPPNRPCTVLAQIKGFTDVAAHVRISGSYFGYKIQVAALNSTNLFMLDASYKLGTPYTIRIAAGQDRIQVFYNDMVTPAVDLFHTAATADPNVYFKVGNYLQTNPSTGENPAATAEVWLYSLQLSQA